MDEQQSEEFHEIVLTPPKLDDEVVIQVETVDRKRGYCLSCRNHCEFEILEVCAAKNPKTEVCKGVCNNQKIIINEKDPTDEQVVLCGKKVCSIRAKKLTEEELAIINAKQLEEKEAKKAEKEAKALEKKKSKKRKSKKQNKKSKKSKHKHH